MENLGVNFGGNAGVDSWKLWGIFWEILEYILENMGKLYENAGIVSGKN